MVRALLHLVWPPLVLVGCALDGMCADVVRERHPSPDGRREAVVFDRSCDATTDWSTQTALVGVGEAPPDRPANAFIARRRIGVWLRWEAPDRLVITTAEGPRLVQQAPEAMGVRIRYRQLPPGTPGPAQPPEPKVQVVR